jgi:hypothetical protein
MSQRLSAFTLALLLLGSLAGCASDGVEVSTTYDPLTSFPAQATYRWDERANKLPTDPRIVALDLDPILKAAAEEEFAARGYRAAVAPPVDYRLSYELVVHTWIGADNSRSVGSLSMLLVEAETGRRVWLGFGRAEIQVGRTRAERKQRLREALARILENFPPTQRGD